MISLFLRNLFFTILQPGVVAGVVPYLLLKGNLQNHSEHPVPLYQFIGEIIFIIGLIIMTACIINFAVRGKGTLSPVDPTRRLVIEGLYKFSRNPMYIGVMLILIGEAIFFQSSALWIYSTAIFIVFNLFIIYFEEPRLKRDFGEEYVQYCKAVRRWL